MAQSATADAVAGGGAAVSEPPGDSPESAAVAEARRTGKPVAVESMRTETSDVVAQPDGKLVATEYLQPQRTRRNGAWVDIDPTLRIVPGGGVAPGAVTSEVEFSGGGSGQPLVRMARAGKELKLSWPKALPKPVLDGSTAEYRSILPDVDLKLTATATGFTQLVVVRTAEAAKNPELDQLRLGLQGEGLTIRREPDGSLSAVDKGAGGTVFRAPKPLMWDSSKAAPSSSGAAASRSAVRSAVPGSAAPSSAPGAADGPGQPSVPGRTALVAVSVTQSQDALLLTPSQTMLDDPATVFPVVIDPSWDTPRPAEWAGVSQYYSSQSYWHFSYNSDYVGEFGVGYCGDTSRCAPRDVQRVLYRMPTAQFAGKRILSATFSAQEVHSYDNCDDPHHPVELWWTSGFDEGTNWNDTQRSGFWEQHLQTVNPTKGAGCGSGDVEFGASDVKGMVQRAADGGWDYLNLGLRAGDESDLYGWQKFSTNAALRIRYNLPPRQTAMSDLSMQPGSVCQNATVRINKVPQVTALASDPDGEPVAVQFSAAWDAGDGTGWKRHWWSTDNNGSQTPTDFKASGSLFSYTLPSTLPLNTRIAWDMRAWDGAQWGPTSSSGDSNSGCYFLVDTSAPDGPTVSASDYPVTKDPAGTLSWSDGVGKYGAFTIGSASKDTVKYQWGLDTSPSAANEIATTGGSARTINVLPDKPGVHWISLRSIDGAGNASSQDETYYFAVRTGQPQRAGWSMDDRSGSTTLAGSGGGFDATLGTGAKSGTTGHKGNALQFDGTADGYAQAQSGVLDTAGSYTVSAWVNLADASRNRSAVSQGGQYIGAFSLGVRSGQWALQTTTRDDSGYAWQVAASTVPVTLNQWTHLAGAYDAKARTITLYVNGTPTAPVPAPAAWSARNAFDLGRLFYRGGYTDPWKGQVDEVKLWDRALTTTETAALAGGTMPTTGTGAKAVWELDETGNTVTGKPETSPLTLSGGAANTATGVTGQALHLDGTSGYARTNNPQLDGAKSFSVSAWVKLPKLADGDTSAHIALSQIGEHNSEFSIYYSAYYKRWLFARYKEDTSADTLVRTMQPDCTPGSIINGVPCMGPTENQWTHLAAVSDTTARKLRLYINGYLVGESDYTQTSPWAKPGPLQLGAVNREGANGEYFGGDIDDVRIFDRVLTTTEARDMVRQRPQLAGRWKLNTATAKTTPDESPFAAGATLGGTATIDTAGGIFGGALSLDGTTGYAEARNTPLRTGESFTLAGWVLPAATPTRDMTVFSLAGANGNSAVVVRWNAAAGRWQVELADSDSSTPTRTSVTGTPARSWTHLAVVYDAFASRVTLYVNGRVENFVCADGDSTCTSRVATASAVRPFESYAAAPHTYSGLQIGRRVTAGAWGEFFSGEIDDVWAYQGVLGGTQIALLASKGGELPTQPGV
ncbi:LamG domain-containing protein [Saccharothrix sp. ST-888]|uniref:LamG domain-containing protein n=1 Tax=Saccharothrix sp. ST-888 TaxID=1427391 RepID=UPI0012E04ADE|nr:LamG domain-containing protein [Saccharothrix sp. ST-888]